MDDTQRSVPPRANDYQVGGSHYMQVPGEMLWDRIVRLNGLEKARSFFTGNIMSYLEMYTQKDGIKDLKKAAHFLHKLIELEEQHQQDTFDAHNEVDSKE